MKITNIEIILLDGEPTLEVEVAVGEEDAQALQAVVIAQLTRILENHPVLHQIQSQPTEIRIRKTTEEP